MRERVEALAQRARRWAGMRDWDEGAVLLALGALIGVLSGLAVVAFYRLIDLSHFVFIQWPGAHLPRALYVVYWPLLTAVGLWAAWLVVRHARLPDGQNVPDVQLAIAKHDAVVPGWPVLVRTLASAITLGSGGSAGSEGPVAVLGAGLGSALGSPFRIQPRHRKVLVGCGAAAGIAAAFNAPFAGAFFALEEILGSFSVDAFSPVVIASVTASLTARYFLGEHTIFRMAEVPDSHPITTALLYPVLGLACGAASALFSRAYLVAPSIAARIIKPAWLRPLVGGALVGVIVVVSGGLLAGNGHLAIPTPVLGGLAWWILLLVALGKIIATVITLSTGGSGGVFTPTLFIGAALGGGVGRLLALAVPGDVVHPQAWALVGMAGMVAGATRAPLTAIFMVFEITNDSAYIIPLIIVAVLALVTAKKLAPYGLYDGWLAARGEHIAHGVDQAVMDRIALSAAIDRDVPFVPAGAHLDLLVDAAARSRHAVIPVVDDERGVIGLVTHHGLREALVRRSLESLLVAEDLAEPVQPLRIDQSLRDALRLMNAGGFEVVPVVDGTGGTTLVGVISRAAVLEAYERHLAHTV
ncbi:MAG TPA: chloride channel protein [Gemmatimonadaceae bacterium]